MSKIKVIKPIIHLPSYKKWKVPGSYVGQMVSLLGLEPLYPGAVHKWYSYSNKEGVAKLLPHLIQKSSLYKPSVFTCINYAFKVWNLCGELYGLNTWVPVIGRIPNSDVRHAWILIMPGDETGLQLGDFAYFEPNDGFEMGEALEMAYQAFPIGEEGYNGEFTLY